MLSVQNYNMNTPQVSFKQNEETSQKPFVTHAGLKTGAVVGSIGAASTLGLYSVADRLIKLGESALGGAEEIGAEAAHDVGNVFSEMGASLKAAGKKLWITLPIGIAVYTGCGALIDKLTNDKRAKFAQDNAGKDTKEVVRDNPDAELTRCGEVYQRTNTGKKFGTLLGAVVLPIWSKTGSMISKSKPLIGVVGKSIIGALGGLILGSIADHYANKGAKKYADKMGG